MGIAAQLVVKFRPNKISGGLFDHLAELDLVVFEFGYEMLPSVAFYNSAQIRVHVFGDGLSVHLVDLHAHAKGSGVANGSIFGGFFPVQEH